MICDVVGKLKKPYEVKEMGATNSGITCRLSLHVGKYVSNSDDVVACGEQYIEIRCPESIFDQVNVGDVLSVEADDKLYRIKSAMLQVDNGGFLPI